MDSGAGFTQTLLLVVLFVAAMASLPWLIRRLQQRQAMLAQGSGAVSRVVSAVAVGPHQRVVTVEVGPAHARTQLVLGVTAQQIQCLHVLPVVTQAGHVATPPAGPSDASFAQALGAAVQPAEGRSGV